MKRVIAFIVIVLLLAACRPDPNDDFIQGTWSFANEQGDERSGSAHVLQEWWFGRGAFFFQQEIVFGRPLIAEGNYRILESSGDRMILQLYSVEGNTPLSDGSEITILIDREADTVRIGRVLYVRFAP